MKKLLISIGGILVLGIISTGCAGETPTQDQNNTGLPNPASVYCEEQGGRIEIRQGEGGEYGVCIFEDGSECDEWAYFRGECAPGAQDLQPVGGDTPTENTPLAQTDQQTYLNETYGFTITAPSGWEVEDNEDYVLFKQPGYQLFIGYQWANEELKPFRTGMPSGEFVEGGEALLMGQSIPKNILVFEGKNKVVDYGGRIKVGDLLIVMYLDGLETETIANQDIDIPAELIAEADQIIAAFGLTSGQTPQIERNP